MSFIDSGQDSLSTEQLKKLEQMRVQCITDIIEATSLAACGHPGGAMSSLHILLMAYAMANISPEQTTDENRDRVVVSHGHISPGVYSVLSRYGFFNSDEMILHFRKLASKYAGHVEDMVNGVEWNTGNLGQGVSAAVGMALAGKMNKKDYKTIVFMGDGEQQKGQIAEARRAAAKFGLNRLMVVIDYNRYQIGGKIEDVMPQNIAENYLADNWNVIEIDDAHNFESVFQAYKRFFTNDFEHNDRPLAVIASTVMGHGVSFMKNGSEFHGRACTPEEHTKAMKELGMPDRLSELQSKRKDLEPFSCKGEYKSAPAVNVNTGKPIVYDVSVMMDNRSAYGNTLADLGRLNNTEAGRNKIAGVSCDLEGSVKMSSFRKENEDFFIEAGIQEHHAAVMAGALSKHGFQVFFSTFGIFGVDEVFNQQRLNAFNSTNLKTVCTHLGLSVGEDGPTHQCVDYIGLLRNIPGYSVFIPADPNQTDKMVRYAAGEYGNFFIGMGRAKTPVIANSEGKPFFGDDYTFTPGKADLLSDGGDATLIAMGPLLDYAVKAARELKDEGLNVRVVNMGSVIPFDEKSVIDAAGETGAILTVEDHLVHTGIGAMVDQTLIKNQVMVPVEHLGVKGFVASGTPDELYEYQGMGLEDIKKSLRDLVKRKKV